ncbi:hypothetical protein EPD60_08280 [Flaviaesturariibacter flavus]|uniref:Uncharacterized protein n=1 Tax=Flaviaesturariibacter flavus TaxID=2502780 RepID=A0A4V2NVL6_9BACT|nr:hypothetical protein [Flaviaesturariibacter flavus]TCJ14002.1 hypothetical protein EPD60_08280 [Flaviaesturariibacter flavus]
MAKQTLNENGRFLVGEEVGLALVAGGILACLSVAGLIAYIYSRTLPGLYMTLVMGFFAIPFLKKGIQNRVSIRVDRSGFYYYGEQLFTWDVFHRALVVQEDVFGSLQDHFYLVLEYEKPEGLIRRRIRLTNTQNKSEEEVIGAIRFYSSKAKGEEQA